MTHTRTYTHTHRTDLHPFSSQTNTHTHAHTSCTQCTPARFDHEVKFEENYRKVELEGGDRDLWSTGLREDTGGTAAVWVVFGACSASGVALFDAHVDADRASASTAATVNARLDSPGSNDGTDGDRMDTSPGGSPAKPTGVAAGAHRAWGEEYADTDSIKKLDLKACLDAYITAETLDGTDTYYCSGCKQHLSATKKLDLWSVPDVLIVHLKRFRYIASTGFTSFHHREKIGDLIDFPTSQLDLSSYVRGPTSDAAPPVYELYGVSEHFGGMGGGHYTAKCQNPVDGRWYSFNDSSVTETTAKVS